jgi:hypothetical protein
MRQRTWIILLAVALALVIALPAGAGKPDKPDKPEKPTPDLVFYDVTLDRTGAEGLGLCAEEPEGPLVMVDIDGALLADGTGGTSVPRLDLRAEVPWRRSYPAISGEKFVGCHGGPLLDSESNVPSYFIIHTDRSGDLSNVLWAFDVYVKEGTKGRNKTAGVPKEYFRLWGAEDVSFLDASGDGCLLSPTDAVTCYVSGSFEVWHYYPIEQIGDADFMFTMTIEPH